MRLLLAAVLTLGGLGLASATALAGGCHNRETTASQSEGQAVVISGCGFRPVTLVVSAGTTVTWTNADPVAHNVVGVGWGDWQPFVDPSAARHTFVEPGTYPYQCTVHPGMAGVVVVGSGQASATAASGLGGGQDGLAGALALAALAGGLGLALGRRLPRGGADHRIDPSG